MFTRKWSTSERKYDVVVERDVRGTGKSEGFYQLMGPVEVEDICHLLGGELCGVAPRRHHSRHKLRRQLAQPPVRHAPAARHIGVGELPGL